MPVNRLTVESNTVSGTHISTPVSVAAITGDWTLKLLISAFLSPGDNARILIEESPDGFSTARPLIVWNYGANPLPPEGQILSYRKREAQNTDLFGTSGAEIRLNVVEMNGSFPSLTYDAWLEY